MIKVLDLGKTQRTRLHQLLYYENFRVSVDIIFSFIKIIVNTFKSQGLLLQSKKETIPHRSRQFAGLVPNTLTANIWLVTYVTLLIDWSMKTDRDETGHDDVSSHLLSQSIAS